MFATKPSNLLFLTLMHDLFQLILWFYNRKVPFCSITKFKSRAWWKTILTTLFYITSYNSFFTKPLKLTSPSPPIVPTAIRMVGSSIDGSVPSFFANPMTIWIDSTISWKDAIDITTERITMAVGSSRDRPEKQTRILSLPSMNSFNMTEAAFVLKVCFLRTSFYTNC